MIRARQINQTWKMHKLERKCSQSGHNYIIFFFSKSLMMDILFAFSGTGAKMKSSVAMLKPVKMMINVRNAMGVAMKVKSGYVVLHVINGTMKTAFYE